MSLFLLKKACPRTVLQLSPLSLREISFNIDRFPEAHVVEAASDQVPPPLIMTVQSALPSTHCTGLLLWEGSTSSSTPDLQLSRDNEITLRVSAYSIFLPYFVTTCRKLRTRSSALPYPRPLPCWPTGQDQCMMVPRGFTRPPLLWEWQTACFSDKSALRGGSHHWKIPIPSPRSPLPLNMAGSSPPLPIWGTLGTSTDTYTC